MTEAQKLQIQTLRQQGAGYLKIAQQTGISKNTVKSYCRRNNLSNTTEASTGQSVCECCGNPVEHKEGFKKKRFCSDTCRNKWWNSNLSSVKRKAVYTFVCPNCGKTFEAYGNSNRKYCSHSCYVAHRFGVCADG